MNDAPSSPTGRVAVLYWAILLAGFAAYLFVHQRAGLTFPIPWADEGTFLWQALAFARDGTLCAPQINPERCVMNMPPGYMVAQGLIFKATGFSFEWARLLSALYLVVAMATLARLARPLRPAPLVALLIVVFMLNRNFVLMGNIARADTLMLAFALGAFCSLAAGRPYVAFALVSLSPLVHPNGLFFCVGAGGLFLVGLIGKRSFARPGRAGTAAMLFALACWIAYGVYAAQNWAGVENDLGFALTWKGRSDVTSVDFWHEWVKPLALIRWLLLAGALLHIAARRREAAPLLALAFSLQLLDVVTHDWMYRVQTSLLHLIITVLWVDALHCTFCTAKTAKGPRAVVALALAILSLGLNWRLGEIEDPFHYPAGMTFDLNSAPDAEPNGDRGAALLRIASSPPYIEEEDLRVIGAYLGRLEERERKAGSDRVLRVSIFPWGESIALQRLESPHVQLFHPTFTDKRSDISIVHLSRFTPHYPPLLPKWKMQKHVKNWTVLRARDETERWYIEDRSLGAKASP